MPARPCQTAPAEIDDIKSTKPLGGSRESTLAATVSKGKKFNRDIEESGDDDDEMENREQYVPNELSESSDVEKKR